MAGASAPVRAGVIADVSTIVSVVVKVVVSVVAFVSVKMDAGFYAGMRLSAGVSEAGGSIDLYSLL